MVRVTIFEQFPEAQSAELKSDVVSTRGFHLGGFFPVTFIGLYYAWRLGLSVREVEASEERVEAAVEEAHPELTRSRREAD